MTTVLAALFAALAAVFALLWRSAEGKLRQRKAKGFGGAVPSVPVWELDPLFALTPFGPSRDTEVLHVAAVKVEGGVSDLESWILSNLAKRAERIFELGTATGKTTYLLARNAPPNARVTTITLAPEQAETGRHDAGDAARDARYARRESAFSTFAYSGSEAEAKIEQLFGDSKAFDETAYAGAFDLIFIDGDHTESYVRNDTEKALRMLKPGGWLLWHDYRGPRGPQGPWRVLNQLAAGLPLRHVQGTSLVAYRSPAPVGTAA